MRLSESKLNLKNYLYFHGSRHAGKLSQIDAPTPENIFFVTADLDYAMEYAKFNTQSDARNIYVVTLNEDKLNVFDVWRDEISSNLKKKWSYPNYASKSRRKLRSLFCKDLLEEGYNAYSTEELTHKHKSDYCYGIFDKSALETLVLTPIDQNVAKKAIDKLAHKGIDDYWYFSGDDDDKRNYSESNAVIHAFMKEYKEMKK